MSGNGKVSSFIW